MSKAPRTNDSAIPAALGYRMPAEWEPHEATLLSWPYNLETWGSHLDGAEAAMTEWIRALAPHERVDLLVADAAVEERAHKTLNRLKLADEQLRYLRIESGDVWIRDYGPVFLKHRETGAIAWTKWTYNAYGGKWQDLLIGNDVPDQLPTAALPRFEAGLVLEGGSVDVNGSGTLLTTESCLLSPDRNPGRSQGDIERVLKDYFGASNILWLGSGIAGDDTTGHVDDLTRFVNASTVVTAVEDDPADENYQPLQENLRRLKTMRDERGTPLTVILLPMPRPFDIDGRRMAASYANFYIANGVVLMPTYAQESDASALGILQECFSDRRVIGVDCSEFIWGYGSIHCATQQQPRGGKSI